MAISSRKAERRKKKENALLLYCSIGLELLIKSRSWSTVMPNKKGKKHIIRYFF